MAKIVRHNHIAYRCPECGTATVGLVSEFALNTSMMRLKCSCGGSSLDISLTREKKLKLSVPCVFCKENHNFTLSQEVFFFHDLFQLDCPYAAMDIGYIGRKKELDEAIEKGTEALNKLLSNTGCESIKELQPMELDEEDALPDAVVYDTIRLLVKDMEAEGTIDCPCHSGSYDLRYAPSGIQVFCPECGASHIFNCEAESATEDYLSLKELKLR